MKGTLGFHEVQSSTTRHYRIADTFSVLTISSLSPQASGHRRKRFLTPFLSPIPQWFQSVQINGVESHLDGAVRGNAIPIQPGGHR